MGSLSLRAQPKCPNPPAGRAFSSFSLSSSDLWCLSLHWGQGRDPAPAERSLSGRRRWTGTFVPQTCHVVTSMGTAGRGRSGVCRTSATAMVSAMGSNCPTVCLSWRMLLEGTRDQVLGQTPILTRGNFRRWAQAALHRGRTLFVRHQILTPVQLEGEILLVLVLVAKQTAHW